MLSLTANQISDITPLVENSGLSGTISLGNNNLDLSEGSEDLENIRKLEARGVRVDY
jgi:Leucine-rich repeat (LRR) protein